jgi:hypothetical protein
MLSSYDKIYEDSQNLIKKYNTRDPKEILQGRGVFLIPFQTPTTILGMYKIIMRNRFVFYNPFVDERIINMVLAHELGHDIYHKKEAKDGVAEYELFDINTEMEIEANIFAAHLLLDENKLMDDIKEGYTYQQLASLYDVNVNLMIFKLNEMHRMGLPVNKNIADSKFFTKIDGRDEFYGNLE